MGTLHRFAGTQNLWSATDIEIEDEDNSSTMGRRQHLDSDTSDLGSVTVNHERGRELRRPQPTLGDQTDPRDRFASAGSHSTVSQLGVNRSMQQPSRRTYIESSDNRPLGSNGNQELSGSQYSVRDRENSFLARHFVPSALNLNTTNNSGTLSPTGDFPPDPFRTLRRPQERLVDPKSAPQRRNRTPSPASVTRERQHFQETFQVKIRKRNNSFGFKVVGGSDNPKPSNGDPSIVVSDVTPRGAVDGILRPRDVVLKVNDYPMHKVAQADYHEYLSYAVDEAVFEIGRPPPSTMTLDPRIGQSSLSQSFSNAQTRMKRLTLTKMHPDEDFGVRVGVKYFIRYIPKNSCASRGNELKPNDILLKINGKDASEIPTMKDVQSLINNQTGSLELVVESPALYSDIQTQDLLAIIPSPSLNSAPNSLTSDSGTASMLNEDKADLTGAPLRPPLPQGSQARMTQSRSHPTSLTLNVSQMGETQTGGLTLREKSSTMDDGGFSAFNATKAAQLHNSSQSRVVQLDGSRHLGLKLAGGNATGVFITAVQEGSQSKKHGLTQGDEIIEVAQQSTVNLTREQVLKALQGPKSTFDIVIRKNNEGFRRFNGRNSSGDSFYIRVHMSYSVNKEGHLSFDCYDILHVTDTLPAGKDKEGHYYASRVNHTRKDGEVGLIPNQAEAAERRAKQEDSRFRSRSHSRGGSLASRTSKRFRSSSRDRGKGEINERLKAGPSTAAVPVYERVRLKNAEFLRPVVIFGPIADLARDQLVKDSSQKYQLPEPDDFAPNVSSGSTVNIGSIKEVMNQNCHCVLDVSPQSVQWLNMVGLYPIVIFFKPKDKEHVKEVRASFKSQKGVGVGGQKISKELFQVAMEIEKHYAHLISDTIHLTANNVWYAKLTDTIKKHQAAQIWQAETPNVDHASIADVSLSVGQWATSSNRKGGHNSRRNETTDNLSNNQLNTSHVSSNSRTGAEYPVPKTDSNVTTPTTTLHRNNASQRSRSESAILEDQEGVYEVTGSQARFGRNGPADTSIAGSQDSRSRHSATRSRALEPDFNSRASDRGSMISSQSQSRRPGTLMSAPNNSMFPSNPSADATMSTYDVVDGINNPTLSSTSSQQNTLRASQNNRQQTQMSFDRDQFQTNSNNRFSSDALQLHQYPQNTALINDINLSPTYANNITYRTNTGQWQRPMSQQNNAAAFRSDRDTRTLSDEFSNRSVSPSLPPPPQMSSFGQRGAGMPVNSQYMHAQTYRLDTERSEQVPSMQSQFSKSNQIIQRSSGGGPNYFRGQMLSNDEPMNL